MKPKVWQTFPPPPFVPFLSACSHLRSDKQNKVWVVDPGLWNSLLQEIQPTH